MQDSSYEYNSAKRTNTSAKGKFFGLGLCRASFGEVAVPRLINTIEEFIHHYGKFSDAHADHQNEWMQIWNALQYTQNMKVFRMGKKYNDITFTGDVISAVGGSQNAHLFFNDVTSAYSSSLWSLSDNGSDVYFSLNDWHEENAPDFGANQRMFISAKYTGSFGNGIGITIINSNADYQSSYIFRYDSMQLTNSALLTLTVGETIKQGSVEGVIEQIIQDPASATKMEVFYRLRGITGFTSGVALDNGMMITGVADKDDFDGFNYSFSEMFDNPPENDEILVAILRDGEILETHKLDFDITSNQYVENIKSDYIKIMDNRTTIAKAHTVVNQKLSWGLTTTPSIAETVASLGFLKDDSRKHIIFSVDVEDTVAQFIESTVDLGNIYLNHQTIGKTGSLT